MFANGTSTLVSNGSVCMVVDTLGPWSGDTIVSYFEDNKMHLSDVQTVVGTHLHTDHIGNLNMFPKSKQIVGDQESLGDLFRFDLFKTNLNNMILDKDIELWYTPGHTSNDVSVIVRNVDRLGTVAITGDLFESSNDLDNENIWIEAGSFDEKLQRSNRKLILDLADYIVPGHGPMFKVTK